MGQSLARNILHVTFSTKLRRPLIMPELRRTGWFSRTEKRGQVLFRSLAKG